MKKTILLCFLCTLFSILLVFLLLKTHEKITIFQSSHECLNSILKFAEKNQKKVFTIDKITYFSGCDANINTNSNSSFTISNLHQFTDIAIFINNNSNGEPLTAENTLKSVTLKNISYSLKPSLGTPNLYYKNINNFATSNFSLDDKIQDCITFNTTSEDEIDFSEPILYNNCANPIVLCYDNSEIQKSYTLSNEISNLSHDGSLLKSCGITLNSISCKIELTVEIENSLNEIFSCPVSLSIPLSTENETIYDGNLTLKNSVVNYTFIRGDGPF